MQEPAKQGPLVFSASGGMAPAATTTFKRLASLTSDKQKQDYNKTIAWIRCLFSFSLVRSSVMCLRRTRSSYHCPARPDCDTPPGFGPLRRSRPNLPNCKLPIWTTFIIHFITLLHLVCIIYILYIYFSWAKNLSITDTGCGANWNYYRISV